MKIKMKLIIVTAILLIVTVTAFGVFLNIVLNSTAKTLFDNYLRDVSKLQAVDIDDFLNDLSDRYNAVTSLPAIKNFSDNAQGKAAAEKAFDALVSADAPLASAVIFDDSGKVIVAKGENSGVATASGICNDKAADGKAAIFAAEGADTFSISLKDKVGKFNVGLVFRNTGIANIIQRSKGLLFVVDPYDSVASVSQKGGDHYGGNYSAGDIDNQFLIYKDFVSGASVEPSYDSFDTDTGKLLAYAAQTPTHGWRAVVYQSASEATSLSSSVSGTVTGIAVAMLVIFLVAAIILIIVVTKPFYKIQETLLKISRGDHEARVEIMSRNEYGDIARVFNDIVDNIIVSESRYRTIIEMSDNIIFEWNLTTKEVIFSNNFNKKFSYRAPSEHFADSFLIKCKVHPEDADRYTSDLQQLEKGENFKHNEYRIKNIYGDYIWVLIRTASILDQDGKAVKIVGVIVDIDRAKKSENILTARASFDSLTNVFNRETIEVAINNEIELIAARKTEFAILFVDIDDFKFYNDQYSHATGDQVLRFTATTIKNAVGDKGMVGRYGGDEFIVCVKDADANDPAIIAQQILNTLKEGFDSDSGDHFSVNVSIGIAVIKDNTKRVEEIIGQADDAMYRIKKSGKSNFGFLET